MIHHCFQATGKPTTQYLIYIMLNVDEPSGQEINSQMFFDLALAYWNERVN